MKLILSIFLIICVISIKVLSQSSSSSNGGSSQTFKYVKMERYMSDNCTGDSFSGGYVKSDACYNNGYSRAVCQENGDIINLEFTDIGCGGTLNSKSVIPVGCSNGEYITCVEDFEIPSNTVSVYETTGKCKNDENWQDDVVQISFYYLDMCIPSGNFIVAQMAVCDDTIAHFNIYDSNNTCTPNNISGFQYLIHGTCSKSYPNFFICDKNTNYNSSSSNNNGF